jgi:glucose-6-phosphate 1-dehydrogenase
VVPSDPCLLVIFGASGDLTARKLVPALYEMWRLGALDPRTAVVGVSRTAKTDDAWRDELAAHVRAASLFDDTSWREFATRIFYVAGDAVQAEVYPTLAARLDELARTRGTRGNLLFYLSVAESLYEPIIERIDEAGLVTEGKRWCSIRTDERSWQRIIIEKPFGHDEASAAGLNRALGRVFEEESIYRIDHYLAKEVVQSLLVLRFANTIFEPIWNCRYIDHVQITAAESIGVGNRTAFYDETGAIRDMIQSHLLQVLAFVAMEPPNSMRAHAIRAEKIKVIEAIREPPAADIARWAALGQYAADAGDPAYHETPGVAKGSRTETFAALRFQFDNWRWADTPFFVRTGKKLARKLTEVVVQFKPPAANLFRTMDGFGDGVGRRPADRMVIQIAPRGEFSLRFECKVPGWGITIDSVEMAVDYEKWFGVEAVESYGPLIVDAMRGDQSLFKSRFEVEGSWRAVMPFLDARSEPLRRGIAGNYRCGSWGPEAAHVLLASSGRVWHDPAEAKAKP